MLWSQGGGRSQIAGSTQPPTVYAGVGERDPDLSDENLVMQRLRERYDWYVKTLNLPER
jgi:hypothetical protein